MKKKTLSVLIPAYNESASVAGLVVSITKQRINSAKLVEIIVASDGSTDNTVSSLKSLRYKFLKIIDSKKRLGKASRLNQMFSKTNTDITIVFDADIIIKDESCIEKLISPLLKEEADMTSSSILELPPTTFFEEVLDVSMQLKRILFSKINNGNNIYNCHGPARAFTKYFYKRLNFIDSSGEDMFSYLTILKMNGRFKYVKESLVSYKLPSVAIDHYKQSFRYLTSIEDMKIEFGKDFVNKEFFITSKAFLQAFRSSLSILATRPLHVIIYMFTLISTYFGKFVNVSPKELWRVSSSKNLNNFYAK